MEYLFRWEAILSPATEIPAIAFQLALSARKPEASLLFNWRAQYGRSVESPRHPTQLLRAESIADRVPQAASVYLWIQPRLSARRPCRPSRDALHPSSKG